MLSHLSRASFKESLVQRFTVARCTLAYASVEEILSQLYQASFRCWLSLAVPLAMPRTKATQRAYKSKNTNRIRAYNILAYTKAKQRANSLLDSTKAKKLAYTHLASTKAKKLAYQKQYKSKHADSIRAYQKAYAARPTVRAKAIACRNLPANKTKLRAYQNLPDTKARALAHRNLPENKAREQARNRARASRVQRIEKQYVKNFLVKHPELVVTSGKLTDAEARVQLMELLHSRAPHLLGALSGMTLHEAFVKRKLNASMYIYLARGTGLQKCSGRNYSESERFLVNDPNPTLTQLDGSHYKVSQQAYKDLGLKFLPMATFETASACATFEAGAQEYFDKRWLGGEKLWKVTGAGRVRATFRRCDISYMERTGDYTSVFTCGITWTEGVCFQGLNDQNQLTRIVSGEGQESKVHQRKRWADTWARDRAMFQ